MTRSVKMCETTSDSRRGGTRTKPEAGSASFKSWLYRLSHSSCGLSTVVIHIFSLQFCKLYYASICSVVSIVRQFSPPDFLPSAFNVMKTLHNNTSLLYFFIFYPFRYLILYAQRSLCPLSEKSFPLNNLCFK